MFRRVRTYRRTGGNDFRHFCSVRMYAAFTPVFSRYRKQRLLEQTCFRALKINGNGNSKVFDRRTKPFHQIVLLCTVYPVHGTMGIFAVPEQTTWNSKVGYMPIWTEYRTRKNKLILEKADFSLFGVFAPLWSAEIAPNHKQNYGGFFNMNVRNEIKAQIIRAGLTMQEVVDLLSDEYGWSDSVSNLSAKLQRESTIRGSIGACRCAWLRHRMAEKTGEVMPRQQPPASPVPIGAPQCCLLTGSERYGFRCRRLQEMFRRTASCRRADHGKRCRHFRHGQQRSPQ